jgi:RNA methyltransferase, TrmH family
VNSTSRIESTSNKQFKWLKSLSKKRNRWKESLFMIEGIRSVEQSLESGFEIDCFVYSDSLKNTERGKKLLDRILLEDYRSLYVEDRLFKEISDTEEPQWIMAVVKFGFKTIEESLKESGNFFILLDRVQDPGNMGTIIRTGEAFGANGIVVTEGCVDVYNPKTVRSTMGAILDIPIIYCPSISEAIWSLKAHGIKVISSSLDTDDMLYSLDLKVDMALIVGNEGSGISEEAIGLSDEVAKIPMVGRAESLNAGVASGVFMYEVLRQRIE